MVLHENMIILEKPLCVLYVYSLKNKKESSEGWWYNIRKEKTCHEKDHTAFRRMTQSRKVIIRNLLLMKYLTLKALPYTWLKKSNMIWHNAKEALISLKSGWRLQTAIFPLLCYHYLLKKKTASSLSSHWPVDQNSTRLKIYKLQR